MGKLTEKDEADLRVGVEGGIDFVALSFVRQAEDVETLRRLLRELGSKARIVAKIEDQAGVRNMDEMLRSSAVLAQELGESGIVVFTRSGFLAYVLGALRAKGVPIFAFTDVESTFRQLLLPWGVEPFLMEFSNDPEQTILDALECLKQKHWCVPGTWLVVITNVLANGQVVDSLQLRQVPK